MDHEKKIRSADKVIRSRPSNRGKKARRKGHNFELTIVKYFKELGYPKAMTTRLASRIMDAAKLDVCNVPLNVQCKAVEDKINYTTLTEEIKQKIVELVPDRVDHPIVIFHKRQRKTVVVMTVEEFAKLIKYGQTDKL
jgi:DNA-directed RNA polymerase subunit F